MLDEQLLKDNLQPLGVELTDEAISRLDKYASLVIETNKCMNLTAICDSFGVTVKHFADSLTLLTCSDFRKGTKVLDLGTGAGFPGVPLLIARPDIDITLIDSTSKKINFVAQSIDSLGLNAETLHARAEEAGKNPEYREKYDIVVSRAVAALDVLAEYCLPFVKVGGVFLAMKSVKADEEIEQASKAIDVLGGKIKGIREFRLSDDAERNVVIIEKSKVTPAKYPRPSAQIAKKHIC